MIYTFLSTKFGKLVNVIFTILIVVLNLNNSVQINKRYTYFYLFSVQNSKILYKILYFINFLYETWDIHAYTSP